MLVVAGVFQELMVQFAGFLGGLVVDRIGKGCLAVLGDPLTRVNVAPPLDSPGH